MITPVAASIFFFFNDTATTEIYTLSLHDALPILIPFESYMIPFYLQIKALGWVNTYQGISAPLLIMSFGIFFMRSEEHTSELQSRLHLVCRLLLEKKKKHSSRTYKHCSGADPY